MENKPKYKTLALQNALDKFTDIYGENGVDMPDGIKLTVYCSNDGSERGFLEDVTTNEMGLEALIAKKWILQSDLEKLLLKEIGIESLTRKEALAQGYTKCGKRGLNWQSLQDIEDLSDDDFKTQWLLADKEAKNPSVSPDMVKDWLVSEVTDMHSSDTGDDSDDVYDAMMKLHFGQVSEIINEALKNIQYWNMTKISLLP